MIEAAQTQAVTLTDSYLSHAIAAEAGGSGAVVGLDPKHYVGRAARGVNPHTVWNRSIEVTRSAMFNGTQPETAFRQGIARLRQAVRTDVQLSTRKAARDRMWVDNRVVGYRRVLGPGKNCDLCTIAATRTYQTKQLMPIHPHCGCTVQEIARTTSSPDIDVARLSAIRNGAGPGSDADYGRVGAKSESGTDVEVVRHGELGPLLWNAAHKYVSN